MEADEDDKPNWIDVLNKLQYTAITIAVFVLIVPCLYEIKKTTTKTAKDVQSINERLTATEQAILNKMSSEEQWQKASEALKQHLQK